MVEKKNEMMAHKYKAQICGCVGGVYVTLDTATSGTKLIWVVMNWPILIDAGRIEKLKN